MFWKMKGITTLEQLKAAAQAGELRNLEGMGAKSEQKILEDRIALAPKWKNTIGCCLCRLPVTF